MTIVNEIDKSKGIVVTRVNGLLSIDELEANQQELRGNPDFDPGFHHLFDMSGVSEFGDATAQIVRRLALVRIFSPSSRRAVIAPDDMAYGLSRMYGAFSRVHETNLRVFRKSEEAFEWLVGKD